MTPPPRSARGRTKFASTATVLVGGASRLLKVGGGSVIGGRVGLAIDPQLVAGLAAGRRCLLVTGTNGKTTTTRLLASALGGPKEVATSQAGANLPAGVAAALASGATGSAAVLEVDERYLGDVASGTSAEVIVLLNLSRDQLDRVNEVRKVAQGWRDAVALVPSATVVANADDPLVVWGAGGGSDAMKEGPKVLYVAAGELWRQDATGCPACGGRITFGTSGGWSCTCGFSRPRLHAELTDAGLEMSDGRVLPISLGLPARCNRSNAAMAAVAASLLGVDEADALRSMADVREVEGRFAAVSYKGVSARLLLAKNPAGWAELFDLLRAGEKPVVVGINARIADGHDPSWLWDVPFEELTGRRFVATGERCLDLAVRLKYSGLAHAVVADQGSALVASGAPAVEYVGNYTAFQQLRRTVASPLSRTSRRAGTESLRSGAREIPPACRTSKQARQVPADSALRIAIVHPDLLGTYGDGGNGRILACRAAWRGISVELLLAGSDVPLPTADIYCLGGGEDAPQVEAASLLASSVLSRAVDNGSAVLAVCAGFQVVGRSFPDATGRECEGLGLLDVVTTKGAGARCVGEVVSEPGDVWLGSVRLETFTGFENHSGVTRLGGGVKPLGKVRTGVGNGDGTMSEGAFSGRVVGTYLHGPVLARNPTLADALLSMVTGEVLAPLDDRHEEALRSERLGAQQPARRSTGPVARMIRARSA